MFVKVKDSQLPVFPHILIVEASAGSGKTYCLARRYLQLLINPHLGPQEIPLESILAITFTNRAALEMKERILEFLKRIALDKFVKQSDKEDMLAALGIPEADARAKAARILDTVVRNYNFFQVQTIDSFINAIISSCAFKLGLSARFKTQRDCRQYLAYSLDALIEQARTDQAVIGLFRGFLRHYLYIENKTGWFPKQNILSVVSALYEKGSRFAGSFIALPEATDELLRQRETIMGFLEKLSQSLPEGTNGRFVTSLSNFLESGTQGFSLENVPDFFKRQEFPANKGCRVPPAVDRLWEHIRAEFRKFCELESAGTYHYYIAIFNKVLAYFEAAVRKDDVLFLEALNKEAHRLFDEESLELPELYYRLATRFRHFLVDEFQDTSRLQWENLSLMVEDALASGGSLFYVGDRKQALYRFRGGEASLFDAVKGTWQHFNVITRSLTRNFRSSPEIVGFVNQVFSSENLEHLIFAKEEGSPAAAELTRSDADAVIDVFKDARQTCVDGKPGGYVKAEFLDYPLKEERDAALKAKLLSLVNSLTQRFAPSEIALLTRTNSEVELFSSWFLEAGIPVESERTLNIRSNPYIKEIISFLAFLDSPINNLAFASFVTGEIFTAASGLTQEAVRDFLFDLKGSDEPAYIYRAFSRRFPVAWDSCIEGFFKSVGFVPLYELAVSIFKTFAVMRTFGAYQGFFMRFLDLIKEQEEKFSSLSAFLAYFEDAAGDELSVSAGEGNAVKILTVHKAKGLEFPVVVIPSLEMTVKVDEEAVIEDKEGLKLLRLKKRYTQFSPFLHEVWRQHYLKAFIDELNTIYVALTRAMTELYMFVPSKAENRINRARLLIGQQEFQRGTLRAGAEAAKPPAAASLDIPASEYEDWLYFLKDEFRDEHILRQRKSIGRGELLHMLFSHIGTVPNAGIREAVASAVEMLRYCRAADADIQECAAVAEKALGTAAIRKYFEPGTGTVYREKEIVDRFGQTFRIDRLILTADEAIVLDYKSSGAGNAGYKEQVVRQDSPQVAHYMELLKELYPERKVRGVLVYLDTLSVEEVG